MGNQQPKTFTLKPLMDKTKNISFGGKKEEEMIQKFNAFDILWYAPEDSEQLENWIAFTNVDVIKTSDVNIFIQRAVKSHFFNLIIISTGSLAKEILPLLYPKLLTPNIIIYCMNSDYYKKWSEKYDSIVGVFTHPEEIFEYLLNLQANGYSFPLFKYDIFLKKNSSLMFMDIIIISIYPQIVIILG